jgi:hypothetical protein
MLWQLLQAGHCSNGQAVLYHWTLVVVRRCLLHIRNLIDRESRVFRLLYAFVCCSVATMQATANYRHVVHSLVGVVTTSWLFVRAARLL